MILLPKTIKALKIMDPCFLPYRWQGVSGGMSYCGYDIAIDQDIIIPGHGFVLASSQEWFNMPLDVVGTQHDKSSWARKGIAVQATVIEPGWRGYLTLEISNNDKYDISIMKGTPIAQILFHRIEGPASPYTGKYQDQKKGPQESIFEQTADV